MHMGAFMHIPIFMGTDLSGKDFADLTTWKSVDSILRSLRLSKSVEVSAKALNSCKSNNSAFIV